MKKIFLLLFVATIIIVACKKDNLKKSMTISNLEVKPESSIAPTKVLVIYSWKVENSGQLNIYHQGAYKSVSEADTTNVDGPIFYFGNWSKTDTLTLYYLHSGSYEIRLQPVGGDSQSKSFALTE